MPRGGGRRVGEDGSGTDRSRTRAGLRSAFVTARKGIECASGRRGRGRGRRLGAGPRGDCRGLGRNRGRRSWWLGREPAGPRGGSAGCRLGSARSARGRVPWRLSRTRAGRRSALVTARKGIESASGRSGGSGCRCYRTARGRGPDAIGGGLGRDRGRRSRWRGAARLMRGRKTLGLLDSRRGLVVQFRTVRCGFGVPSKGLLGATLLAAGLGSA